MPARLVAKHLSRQLNVPVHVENRDGASGMIGTEFVANAAPDGYTIQYTVADSHSINPHLFPAIRYDAIRDFHPIAVIGFSPCTLVVHPKVGAQSFAQFLAIAKAKPGEITFATWGVGSGGHVRMAALASATGVEFNHVPFKGSAPALQSVVSGQVDAMIVPAGMARPQGAAGKIKLLAVDTSERFELVPEVPTYGEQGLSIDLKFWQGVLAPKGTPPDILQTLNRAINNALADPEALAELSRLGLVRASVGDNGLQATTAYMHAEYTRWGTVIKAAHISVR
ncbi:MAG: Bug family tripartite tricarboxylate transporter substrate binding protein [Betaproteobacteria bacterium]